MHYVLGLDINKCTILEMACIVTDGNLKVIAEVSNHICSDTV